ncbi:hypothetical protein GCM10009654_39780 [Streptomyces hebeiensis]|uniref:Uncharacterized protein n=1 Tax=Streptomyces hebeiensis TaxID=229486 RepID=A0ABN1UXD0_9ACTN
MHGTGPGSGFPLPVLRPSGPSPHRPEESEGPEASGEQEASGKPEARSGR